MSSSKAVYAGDTSPAIPPGVRTSAPGGGPGGWRGLARRMFGRAREPVQRLSRWSWTADAVLALALAVTALQGTLGQGDVPEPVVPALPVDPNTPWPPETTAPSPLPTGTFWPLDTIAGHDAGADPSQGVLALLIALPLVLRRRYPLTVFCAVAGWSLPYDGPPGFDIVFIVTVSVIAAYSAAVYSPYQPLATVCVLVGAVMIAVDNTSSLPALDTAFGAVLLFLLLFVAANALHGWRQRIRSLEARHATQTRLAVERERSRIAQELHDVVTHNVSMMVVQTGAARKVMAAAPDRAEQALLAVESGGRAALTELRHVMGLLTMNEDDADPGRLDAVDLAPPPGLDQVRSLVDRVRAAGVPVELTVTGAPGPLPPGVDLAAYRVVQEALTNTVKHAAGASVTITIEHGPGTVGVEVADTGGRASPSARAGNGRGLLGMKERIAVYGGTLDTGPLPDGGYRVHAVVPLEGSR